MTVFSDIKYLADGTPVQQAAHAAIVSLGILQDLAVHEPLVAGTIPIDINIPGSDIDIICRAADYAKFSKLINKLYGGKKKFKENIFENHYVCGFEFENFIFEIYAQNIPPQKQNAYLHMLIEGRILNLKGQDFKKEIIKLKINGIKTEPAFGKLLNLVNPYTDLLELQKMTDAELKKFLEL
ncbi:hypothetical protein AAIR98_000178 [Elusimicrobium simillimum]|uniref:DUF4269 domain-containing protein n=1 Tax=Elusimicrobium simillimum TaxID=3143438 RepID=UPI003C6FCB4A